MCRLCILMSHLPWKFIVYQVDWVLTYSRYPQKGLSTDGLRTVEVTVKDGTLTRHGVFTMVRRQELLRSQVSKGRKEDK